MASTRDFGIFALSSNEGENKQMGSLVRAFTMTLINGPHHDKTYLQGFRKSETQTSLLSY